MYIVTSLHFPSGGVNTLDMGEAFGRDTWFFMPTNVEDSFQAVAATLLPIATSKQVGSFTLAPINTASNIFTGFCSAGGLTTGF